MKMEVQKIACGASHFPSKFMQDNTGA